MAPAGAADSDGQIVAVIADETRQPVADEPLDIVEHAVDVAIRGQKLDHRFVLASKRPQLRLIVRVGQAAHVEHHVGIQRNAVLKAE